MIKGLEQLLCEEKHRAVHIQPGEEEPQKGISSMNMNVWRKGVQKMSQALFYRDRTRGKRHKMKHRRYCLDIREKVSFEWPSKLPNDVLASPHTWKYSKVFCIQCWASSSRRLEQRCWTRWPPEVPFNLSRPMILWKKSHKPLHCSEFKLDFYMWSWQTDGEVRLTKILQDVKFWLQLLKVRKYYERRYEINLCGGLAWTRPNLPLASHPPSSLPVSRTGEKVRPLEQHPFPIPLSPIPRLTPHLQLPPSPSNFPPFLPPEPHRETGNDVWGQTLTAPLSYSFLVTVFLLQRGLCMGCSYFRPYPPALARPWMEPSVRRALPWAPPLPLTLSSLLLSLRHFLPFLKYVFLKASARWLQA